MVKILKKSPVRDSKNNIFKANQIVVQLLLTYFETLFSKKCLTVFKIFVNIYSHSKITSYTIIPIPKHF